MSSEEADGPVKIIVEHSVKKTIIQPDDVTRAKASAWLDLIKPVTEWAGLKGDALEHKRNLLRIEQEETLIKLGLEMRERLAKLDAPVKPIPPKALIPFLEKASLEDPNSTLIAAWANLGVSAAVDYDVEVVRFSAILAEIGPREKLILEEIVGSGIGRWADRADRSLAGLGFGIYDAPSKARKLLEAAVADFDVETLTELGFSFVKRILAQSP
jgi:hypothetical protein